MSLQALQDCAKELRRLAIAGSGLARDDFRLKKIIPELQKTGAKVPVFVRVAASLEELTAASPSDSPRALLQATTLVNAVLYTQVKNGVDGELAPLETHGLTFSPRPTAAKTIRSVIEALTTTGSGRLEVVKGAFETGCFKDLRLLKPALRGFSDPYQEMADFMTDTVLPAYGRMILPLMRAEFNPKGGVADQRRLRVMAALMEPEERRAFCLDLVQNGSKEVRIGAIRTIQPDPECLNVILRLLKDRSREVREAAYGALGHQKADASLEALLKAIVSKESGMAVGPLKRRLDGKAAERLAGIADEWLERLLNGDTGAGGVQTYLHMLEVLASDSSGVGAGYLVRTYARQKKISAIKASTSLGCSGKDIIVRLRRALAESGDERAADALLKELNLKDPMDCLEACVRAKSPELVYDTFSPILTSDKYPKSLKEALAEHLIEWRGFGWRHYYRDYYGDSGEMDEDQEDVFMTRWDGRWLDLAMRTGRNRLVCALLKPENAAAMSHVENLARTSTAVEEIDPALRALARAGFTEWMDLLQQRLRDTRVSAKGAAYTRDALEVFLFVFPYRKLSDAELVRIDTQEQTIPERYQSLLRERISDEKHRRATATRG